MKKTFHIIVIAISFLFSSGLRAQAPPLYEFAINNLLEKAELETAIDSSRLLIVDALRISQDNNFADGTVRAYLAMAHLELEDSNINGALRNYLQLLNLLKDYDRPLVRAQALIELGDIYFNEKMYRNALGVYSQSNQIYKERNKPKYLQTLERIADSYAGIGKIDSAILVSDEILGHHRDSDDKISTVKTLQRIVDVYLSKNDLQSALFSNLELLTVIQLFGEAKELGVVHSNIGYVYTLQKQYDQALKHFNKVESMGLDEDMNLAPLFTNMGVCHFNNGEFNKSISYLRKAEALYDLKQLPEKSELNQLIASVYLNNNDMYNAQLYNEIGMNFAKTSNNAYVLSEAYLQKAEVERQLYNYEEALEYYQMHLNLRDSIRLEERLRQQNLQQQQVLLERAEKEIRLLLVNQDIQNLNISRLELEKDKIELSKTNLELEAKKREDEILLLKRNTEIRDAELENQELLSKQTQQALALAKQELEVQKKDKDLIELKRIEERQKLELFQREAEEARQQREIESLTKDNEITQLELKQESAFRQSVYSISGLLALVLILILTSWWNSRRKNQLLERQNLIIEEEKSKSDKLLLNILPEETAAELKENGVATPKHYEQATVLFSDFAGFTNFATKMSPTELIEEINSCFVVFDEIMERNGLEKIKTIGDAYMAAGGLPETNNSHPDDAVKAALEMQEFMRKRSIEKENLGKEYWDMRIGIHTGPLVAGVVGKNKFAYDIWGDTVNVASRMESNGLVKQINISQATYELIKDKFACSKRGTLNIKNKGEMEMYLVES